MAWPPVPAMLSRAAEFDEIVLDAVARLEGRWGRPFPPMELAVEEVPPSDPAPWEHRQVSLGRLFPATASAPHRVVIYRRPVATRVRGDAELAALVLRVLTEQLAGMLGVGPEDLDPDYDTF